MHKIFEGWRDGFLEKDELCKKKKDDAGNWEEGMKETERTTGGRRNCRTTNPINYRVFPTIYLAGVDLKFRVSPSCPATT